MMSDDKVLALTEADYELPKGQRSVWITVDCFSVRVLRTDEGIVVDLFPVGIEMEEAIAGTYAFADEVLVDKGAESTVTRN